MAQRQKLAVEREKLQAELEHFRKCLTLPQTPHWSRGSHYKGYPPRWPRHAAHMAPRPTATYPFWLTPRVYFPRLGPHGSMEETGWLHEVNEWIVKDGQSLGRSPPQSVLRPTNTCQCSQPPRSARVRRRNAQQNTHAPAFHCLQSLLLLCSAPASLTATDKQTILPMREELLREGRGQRDWNTSLDRYLWPWAFELEMHLMNKSWRTTWWYCVTTKNWSNN